MKTKGVNCVCIAAVHCLIRVNGLYGIAVVTARKMQPIRCRIKKRDLLLPIKTAVLNSLSNMGSLNFFFVFQISNGSRYF